MFTNFESRKEFHKFFFLFEVEVFNFDPNGQKNTEISVYSNIREKKRKFKICESCDEFVITQFKSYFRPPKSASEV